MIRSPGLAASIAVCSGLGWLCPNVVTLGLAGVTTVGVLPPTVTVTVSIVFLPLATVISSWPHCAAGWPRCWTAQAGTPLGTVPVIVVSLHVPTLTIATPPTVTFGQFPVAGQVLGRGPKP